MPATRISSNTSIAAPHNHSFKSQIYNIVPKHALFRVKVNIHQLSNVPLLGGQFGVKWKFKSVQSPGKVNKMKNGKSSTHLNSHPAGRGRDGDAMDDAYTPLEPNNQPGIYVNGHKATDSLDYMATKDPSSSSSTVTSGESSSPPATLNSVSSGEQMISDGRGLTEWAVLNGHTAKWDHSITVNVRMDVDRETSDLMPNELKLTVMQRVVPGDPNSAQNPKKGVVHLNLAEYANSGSVTRRYLLRQSKTNATLQVTVEVEHIGGEQHYRAPPLQKGEILAQVSGLLNNTGFHRAHFLRDLELMENPNLASEDAYNRFTATNSFNGLASSQSVHATEFLIETIFNPVISSTASPFTKEAALPDETASFDSSEHNKSSESGDTGPSIVSRHSGTGSATASTAGSERPRPAWWRKTNSNKAPPRPLIPSNMLSV